MGGLGFFGSLTRLALPWLDFADRSRKITASASGRCHSGLLRVQTWVAVGRLYVCDVLCMYSVYVLGVFFFHAAPCGRVSYQCVPYQCVPCMLVCASDFGLCANCVCVSC